MKEKKSNIGINEFVEKILGIKLNKFQKRFLLGENRIIHPKAIVKISKGDYLA